MAVALSLLLGFVAGLRTMAPLAAVAWAARLGVLAPGGWFAFLAAPWTPWILTLLAVLELVNDKRPSTPSRTVPAAFGARIFSGGLAGGLIAGANPIAGAAVGVAGAVVGTLAGRAFRAKLAAAFGRDLPAALVEDVIGIGLAAVAVAMRSAAAAG